MKKKLLSLLICLSILLGMMPGLTLPVHAETYSGTCGANLTWTLNTDTGVLTISGTGAMTNYTSSTGMPWASYKTSIKQLLVEPGVEAIGRHAFYGCSALTSVTIPDSVTSIGYGAFNECSSLTSVTIPDSVTNISDFAFYGCSSLMSVTIPDGVTSIGEAAFLCCSSLTSVTIPDSVISIGKSAFERCISLTSVAIPDSVTYIGDYAFSSCKSLMKIYVASGNPNYSSDSSGVLFNKNKTELIQCPGGLKGSYIIPSGVTSIGRYAFEVCSSLTSVTIPDSVTSIGKGAFSYCSSLTSVTIPDSVTSIGNCAFEYCSSLTSVTIPDSVTSIGFQAFKNCKSLMSVTIPDSVTSISDGTFSCCSSLTSVTIPDSVTSISYAAFYGCSSLTSVTIPGSVTSIGKNAFCDCSSLTSVTIPGSVTSIGEMSFYNCSSLTRVTILDSVTSIGEMSFYKCSSLTSVTIPDSVTSIGTAAFGRCKSLTKITVASGNLKYCSDSNGVLFNKNKTEIVQCPGAIKGSYSIPDSVTSIGGDAFNSCSSLTSVTIPDSVTSVGSWAFFNCSSLTSVTIPDSVTSIGGYAFKDCSALTSVIVLNPGCSIVEDEDSNTLGDPNQTVIYGLTGSTAQSYAQEWGYTFVALGSTEPIQEPELDEEILHLIFADMAYARIPGRFANQTVNQWLDQKTYLSVPENKPGYDAGEMTTSLFNSASLNRLNLYRMVGSWVIEEVVNGASGYAAVVFRKGDRYIIAYRGSEGGPTTVFDGEDWTVDAEFALLNYLNGDQFGAAVDTCRKFQSRGNVTLTGHSLGGALVAYVSTLTGVQGYSFDGAAGHVIDLTYLYNPLEIDFTSKDEMRFVNITDPCSSSFVADLIQHTNADLFPGVCYSSNPDCYRWDTGSTTWTHLPYSNTRPSDDGKKLVFMGEDAAESHRPKDNWVASVDCDVLGIAMDRLTNGSFKMSSLFGRLKKLGVVSLGTAGEDDLSALRAVQNPADITAVSTMNVLYGGEGFDTLKGGLSSDVLVPGELYGDLCCGGAGSDVYVLDCASGGTVLISDSDGKDYIVLKNAGSLAVQYNGLMAGDWHNYSVGENLVIQIRNTFFPHKFRVVDVNGSPICTISTKGAVGSLSTEPVRDGEEEAESRSLTLMGDAVLLVYDENDQLVGSYSTSEPGLYCEEFGTVSVEDLDGTKVLSATVYASYRAQTQGEGTVDVVLVGMDADGSVRKTTVAEGVDLALADAEISLEDQTVTQDGASAVTAEIEKTVDVTIHEELPQTVQAGTSLALSAEAIFPDGTTTTDVYWMTSDNNVADFESDETGTCTVHAKAEGTAVIYAVAADSGVSAQIEITVICEHDFQTTVVAPTCTEAGYTEQICAICGKKVISNETDALGHSYAVTVTATCTEAGENVCTCSRCGKSCTAGTVGALGHAYQLDQMVVPTCTVDGYSAYTCSRCGVTETESIDALGHEYDEDGTCIRCGRLEPEGFLAGLTDVSSSAYYWGALSWAVHHEPQITVGTSETTFSPKKVCSRAEIVTMLWRAMGCPEPTGENPFVDVSADAYYYKAVLWAFENDITDGVDETRFDPDGRCSRAEVVTFLYRAAGSPDVTATECAFDDVPEDAWYRDAVLWAVENEITDGTSASAFSPNRLCTRAQVVTFLYRFMGEG